MQESAYEIKDVGIMYSQIACFSLELTNKLHSKGNHLDGVKGKINDFLFLISHLTLYCNV